ncbi:MAG: cupin [Edaphobacter sp.]|nr:cupin [Edaphobacter sp.]
MKQREKIEVLGVELEWKLTADDTGHQYCVLSAAVPPGVGIPPHQHPDQEAFYVLDGTPEFGFETPHGLDWRRAQPGEMVNILPNAMHGFRNLTDQTVRVLITCTPNLGRFFEDAGLPIALDASRPLAPPTPVQIHRVLEIAQRYGQRFAPPA